MAIKCPKCQTENPNTQKFCGECAAPLQLSEHIPVTKTMETPKEVLTSGSTFAKRYQIIEELGKGGMGKVYKAVDTKISEKIALKLIKPEIASDKKTLERFGNELRLARKIVHKNVGRMYDINEEKGTHYITMEYVSGQDLKGLIRQSGQLAIGTVLSIAKQVCDGLSEAHKIGIIHRDLKPNNIMIDREGNVRIMDFGIARSLKEKGLTGAGIMIGTPHYMSPEQAEAKAVDQRSDIYSLGVILYEMAAGRVPFEGETALSIAMKHKSEVPQHPKEYNTQIPDDLSHLILKCLEKDKEDRYQSAGELRSELQRIEDGIPTTERIEPKKRPLTSKEITVRFSAKKLFIPALVAAVLLIAAVMIWSPWSSKKAVSPLSVKPSIAVLSFNDLSPQKDQGHLCDGFAESIINALTRVENLRVPASTSSFSFKGENVDVQEIGEKLGVKTILRGSVQKADNRVRITAQLINTQDGSLIWSDQYNRELNDIFAVQDEITIAIVNELRIELLGKESAELQKRYTINPEAYELYLQGRFNWNTRTREGLLRSIEFFKKAIDIDPTYALAYTGLADTYIVFGEWCVFSPKEVYPKAKEAVFKALEIDVGLAEAHCSLAMIMRDYDWDWAEAEIEFKRAIELNPNYATAHQWYAEYLACMGRYDEALKEIERAQELDPFSLIMKTTRGMILCRMGEYDRGIEQCRKVLDLDPSFANGFMVLGRNYLQKGMNEEAVEQFRRMVDSSGSNSSYPESFLGFALAVSDRKQEAQEILGRLYKRSKENYVSSTAMAYVHLGLGEKERAIEFIKKGYEAKDFLLVFFKIDPFLDSIRSDPRIKALLQKMNLE